MREFDGICSEHSGICGICGGTFHNTGVDTLRGVVGFLFQDVNGTLCFDK